MRKLLLLALLSAFCFHVSHAQTAQPEKRLRMGLITGKTILGSYRHDVPWEKAGGGFIGFDLSYAFAKEDPNFTLHFQPNWESYRYQSPGELVVNGSGNQKTVFRSLNVPVLIRLAVPATRWVSPFFELGLGYKVKTNSYFAYKSTFCGLFDCKTMEGETNLKSGLKDKNTTLLVGAGAEFHWGSVQIPVSVRLNKGIGTYTLKGKDEMGEAVLIPDLKTQTLQIVAGITF